MYACIVASRIPDILGRGLEFHHVKVAMIRDGPPIAIVMITSTDTIAQGVVWMHCLDICELVTECGHVVASTRVVQGYQDFSSIVLLLLDLFKLHFKQRFKVRIRKRLLCKENVLKYPRLSMEVKVWMSTGGF
jgi:hypothetical protein